MRKTLGIVGALAVVAMLSVPVKAGVGAQPAPERDRVGLGFDWGVGYNFFNDTTIKGYSGVFELLFVPGDYNKEGIRLGMYVEQAQVSLKNAADRSSGQIRLTGLSLAYQVHKWIDVGIVIGGADVDIDPDVVNSVAVADSVPFADIVATVNVMDVTALRDSISFDIDLDLRYRFLDIADAQYSNGDEIAELSGFQVALSIGVVF